MDIRRRESKTESSSREKRIYEKDQVGFQLHLTQVLCFESLLIKFGALEIV